MPKAPAMADATVSRILMTNPHLLLGVRELDECFMSFEFLS